jgi:hypothetical protein
MGPAGQPSHPPHAVLTAKNPVSIGVSRMGTFVGQGSQGRGAGRKSKRHFPVCFTALAG